MCRCYGISEYYLFHFVLLLIDEDHAELRKWSSPEKTSLFTSRHKEYYFFKIDVIGLFVIISFKHITQTFVPEDGQLHP